MSKTQKKPIESLTISHVGDFTLYPDQLNVAFWYEPKQFFPKRARFHLEMTKEFEAEALSPLFPEEACRWSLPLHFSAFDVFQPTSEHAPEWKKMQALSGEGKNLELFRPWMPFMIYEAHRRKIIDVLSTSTDPHSGEVSENTFYVQRGIALYAFDIKIDRGYFDNKNGWTVNCRGMGDHQESPDHQRIFVAR